MARRLINHTGIVIRPGRNVWRVLVSAKTGWTAKQVMQRTGPIVAAWLGNDSWWYWGAEAQSAYPIGAGDARPIQVIEVAKGGPEAAMGLPVGDILGYNGQSEEEGIDWKVQPAGFPPAWWVYVDFWWRGPDESLPDWPRLDDGEGAVIATPNVCVFPDAQGVMPDMSRGEARGERWADWWGTTVEDIAAGKAGAAGVLTLPMALTGLTSVSSALPWVLGGLLVGGAVLWAYSAGTRGAVSAVTRRKR